MLPVCMGLEGRAGHVDLRVEMTLDISPPHYVQTHGSFKVPCPKGTTYAHESLCDRLEGAQGSRLWGLVVLVAVVFFNHPLQTQAWGSAQNQKLTARNLQPGCHVPLWVLSVGLYKLVPMVIGGRGWRCTGTRVPAVGMPRRLLSSISFLLPSRTSPASLLRSLQSNQEGTEWICGHFPWAAPGGAAVPTWRGQCLHGPSWAESKAWGWRPRCSTH